MIDPSGDAMGNEDGWAFTRQQVLDVAHRRVEDLRCDAGKTLAGGAQVTTKACQGDDDKCRQQDGK